MSLKLQIQLFLFLFGLLVQAPVVANNKNNPVSKHQDPIFEMSLEDLMNVEVVSVSKRKEKLTQVASAAFVISGEDIRRSGATSIPEALRMAPGVQVARIGTDKWSVSIRGFNGRFSNKLLVLMDGRSVYTPLSSGVIWSQQDTFIEDIDRIEVIRGPAATLWGVNAVNGVINIISKNAAKTQGTLLTAGGGSFEQAFVGARYGGMINELTPFRIYAKGFIRDHTTTLSGNSANDTWHSARAGFRIDHSQGIDELILQGDIFVNGISDTVQQPPIFQSNGGLNVIDRNETGGNIRLRWDRTFSERSALMFQAYYDHVRHQLAPQAKYVESFDTDIQQRFPLGRRHNITWGLNYRLYNSNLDNTLITAFVPDKKSNYFVSGFLRDEFDWIPEKLKLSVGVRLGYNNLSGIEVQPNARVIWTLDEQSSLWASVSRAVRTPARGEHDVIINRGILPPQPDLTGLPLPIMQAIIGSNNFSSEKLIAYELGYRRQIQTNAAIDIAGFFNDYSDLRDFELGMIMSAVGMHRDVFFSLLQQEHLMLPILFNNNASAISYGTELSVDWRPHERWRLQKSYSYLNIDTKSNPAFRDIDASTGGAGTANPRHQLSLRSNYDLTERLQFNLWLRYVDKLAFYNISDYVTMDAKMSWKPVRNIEFFLVGQNLFSEHHRESQSDFIDTVPARIPRGIYTGARLDF
ncbi:MAG: TonB-dependent receptor [Nitrosomonas sp.]|nr:TonB-dependent receptor [Nitrosomonas sp.]